MRPDEIVLHGQDAGWPTEVDRTLAGDPLATDESVVARWNALHPGAAQFFDMLHSELDPLPPAQFNAAAVLTRIVGAASGDGQADSVCTDTHGSPASVVSRIHAAKHGSVVAASKSYVYTIAQTIFDGLTGCTVAALFGKKDVELTPVEVERLQKLVDQSKPESR